MVGYGRDPQSGKWRCPAREQWGLGPHQKMTPELEDRVCLTATLTGSYEAAAQLAAKWGSAMNDETIRVHARRVGQRAEEQAQRRLRGGALGEPTVKVTGVKASPFALVIMMDGWLARQGGADWGDGSRQSNLERVAWREIKGAVIYRLEQPERPPVVAESLLKSMWWPGRVSRGNLDDGCKTKLDREDWQQPGTCL
jgi:hypothetical protein